MRSLKTVGAIFALGAAMVTGAAAQVEQAQSGANAFALGTLTPGSGATNRDLWRNADRNAVSDLLVAVPVAYADPLHLELLRRITLSPGEGPQGADNALAGRKFITAAEAGFYRDAASLAELVPGLRSEPALAKVVAYAELLDGEAETACARGAGLRDGRTDTFWVKLRFLCYVRAGETSAADLTLELLRRQDALTDDEYDRYAAFLAGNAQPPASVLTPFDYVMAHELNKQFTLGDLSKASLPIIAAVARDTGQSAEVREAALVTSVFRRTIDIPEARGILNELPSTQLALDLLSVAAQPRGSLEQSGAIGAALRSANGEWEAFVARALLLSNQLPSADPVTNYSPNAAEIALAGMVTGQSAVVEKWLIAMAADTSNANSTVAAGELVNIYALIDPGTARRIGSYLGLVLDPPSVSPLAATALDARVPLASFVSAGLDAAEAGSVGPAGLVYLLGLEVAQDDAGTASVRDAVMGWARDRADLEWMDRQAAFRQAASTALASGILAPIVAGPDSGQPMPRLKPANN